MKSKKVFYCSKRKFIDIISKLDNTYGNTLDKKVKKV